MAFEEIKLFLKRTFYLRRMMAIFLLEIFNNEYLEGFND